MKVHGKEPIEVDSNLPSLETALMAPLARKMPPIMRMIATRYSKGETVQQIARAVGYKESLVSDYLAQSVRMLKCQPITSDVSKAEKFAHSDSRKGSPREFSPETMMVERECESCGAVIGSDEDRVLIAAIDLRYETEHDDDYDEYVSLRVGRALHYCSSCAPKVSEFRMPNPWRIPEELEREYAQWLSEYRAQREARDAKQDASIRKSVATGDMHAFNTAMPTTPSRRDVMAARVILTDPQSARATVFKGRGISMGFILSSGRWDDSTTFSTRVRRESRRIHSRDRWPSRVPVPRVILLVLGSPLSAVLWSLDLN
jgi:hypothetical protein